MKKITELTELRRRTVHLRDAYGNLERDTEEFIAPRPVKSISPGPRFGHFIIDWIAFEIILYIVNYLLELMTQKYSSEFNISITTGLIGSIVLLLLYPSLYAFCEYKWQRTPGKFLTKTLVIDEYGNKPDLRSILLRSLVRIVPFEPVSCYGDKYSWGWHDKWSRTWVVSEEELAELKKLQSEQSDPSY